jgi:hypothetical protein
MALTISQAGSGNSTSSSATLAATLTQSFAVGDMVVVCIASDNNGTNGADSVTSVTDSKSHTYTLRAERNNDPGAAAAGASVNIYTTIVTTAMTTSDVVTANFSPNTSSKAMVIWEVAPGAGETPTYVSNGGNTNNGTNPALTSTSIASGDAVIYALAAESRATLTGDSDTTRGSWSTLHTSLADTGTNGTSMRVGSQYKVVNAAGTQAWGTTLNSSDWAISYIILNPALVAQTVSRTATGSGAGTQTADVLVESLRTATGSGTGSQTAVGLVTGQVVERTATGSGSGAESAAGVVTRLRTATGSGAGSQTAVGLVTAQIIQRTATGSGLGTDAGVGVVTRLRTATGSGVGAQTADDLVQSLRTATGSGLGTESAEGVVIDGSVQRTASGSGVGGSSATNFVTALRTGSNAGSSSGSLVGVVNPDSQPPEQAPSYPGGVNPWSRKQSQVAATKTVQTKQDDELVAVVSAKAYSIVIGSGVAIGQVSWSILEDEAELLLLV